MAMAMHYLRTEEYWTVMYPGANHDSTTIQGTTRTRMAFGGGALQVAGATLNK